MQTLPSEGFYTWHTMMQAEEYRMISEEKIWYADRNKLERMLRSTVKSNNRNWMNSPPWTCLDETNWNFFLSIYEPSNFPIEHWLKNDNSQLALILTQCVWSSDRFSRFFTFEYDITRQITTQKGLLLNWSYSVYGDFRTRFLIHHIETTWRFFRSTGLFRMA
jgi:hypothetical protein